MTVVISGDLGIDKVKDAAIVQSDLAAGVAGTGPAFSYYQSVAQSVPNGSVQTKATFTTQEFDVAASVSASRFQPTVAGYYFCRASYYPASPTPIGVTLGCALGKNGSAAANLFASVNMSTAASEYVSMQCSGLVYLNGSSDYVEVYYSHNYSSAMTTIASPPFQRFSGFLARAT